MRPMTASWCFQSPRGFRKLRLTFQLWTALGSGAETIFFSLVAKIFTSLEGRSTLKRSTSSLGLVCCKSPKRLSHTVAVMCEQFCSPNNTSNWKRAFQSVAVFSRSVNLSVVQFVRNDYSPADVDILIACEIEPPVVIYNNSINFLRDELDAESGLQKPQSLVPRRSLTGKSDLVYNTQLLQMLGFL